MTLSGRGNGKTARAIEGIRGALASGEHVHVASKRTGLTCVDGPAACPAKHRTLAETERELRR